MNIQEINKKLQEWAAEGEVNGQPEKRSVILIALERDEESQDEQKRAGNTILQLIGSRQNLVQSVAEVLGQDSTPMKDIIGKAFEIDIKRRIGNAFMKEFKDFINEQEKEGGDK